MYSVLLALFGAVMAFAACSHLLGSIFGLLNRQYRLDALFLAVGLAVFLSPLVLFTYFHRIGCPTETIPDSSTVVALGFVPQNVAAKSPGDGNRDLAQWLDKNTSKISKILTQEAIIWALQDLAGFIPMPKSKGISLAGHLNGVPVYRIHKHVPGANVRTLETLALALGRLACDLPTEIVLVTHDKQFERAYQDLRSLFGGQIVQPCITNVSYANDKILTPLYWAARELLVARPLEFLQRTLFPLHPNVVLLPIDSSC